MAMAVEPDVEQVDVNKDNGREVIHSRARRHSNEASGVIKLLNETDNRGACYTQTSAVVETNETGVDISKQSVIRTLIVVGMSFMLNFSAFDAFSNLQSSLNTTEGLGTTGLALIYAFMIATNLFVSTFTLSRFNAKWITVFAMSTYILYLATGFYPSWYTVIPASLVIGVGAAHLWLAVVIYVTGIAKRYAVLTKTKEQDRVNLFLGIFYGFMFTRIANVYSGFNYEIFRYKGQVWGNLVSSLVFQRSSSYGLNSTLENCGSRFCPRSGGNSTSIILPSNKQVFTFVGICIGLCTFAVCVVAIFATTVKTGTQKRPSVLKNLQQVTKHLLTSRKQRLLLLPSVFAGLWNAFVVGDFTLAYVSCPYGIENVGFVMITFGIGQSLFSVIFGKISQYTGHLFIYVIGFLAEMGALLTLLLWSPDKQEFYVVFILATLFGMGVAVNNPIVISLYNLYMKENIETAQSSYCLLNSLGWTVAFGYSSVLCTNYKIYILLGTLVVSLVCVTILDCQRKLTTHE